MLDDILTAYDWFDHPDGPKFVETHRNAHRTSGHLLFLPGVFSSFHKVFNNDELWIIHIGKLLIQIIDPSGEHCTLQLGTNFKIGERPVLVVPAGYWQVAEILDGVSFAFGTNICAPSFSFDEFSIGGRKELISKFP